MITRLLIISAIVTTFLVVLGGCQAKKQAAPLPELGASAVAMMAASDGSPMGTVSLTQGANGILVSADLSGLSPGWHGFHIHSVGNCSPDFSAAGGHLSVEGQGHGFMQGEFHSGDMPNIHAAADGTARADVFNARPSFSA
ncbi:MAG: superoxide dismutase family protein, partial [Chloroflexi bacterium]|nr:superoxide dismutase family protein [Chloroflexota bacterium]